MQNRFFFVNGLSALGASSDPKIAAVQQRLNMLTCNAPCESLAVDGVFGPKTRDAVVQFGKANGFSTDGTLSDNIIALINSRSAKSCPMGAVSCSLTPPKPVTAETVAQPGALDSTQKIALGVAAAGVLLVAFLATRKRGALGSPRDDADAKYGIEAMRRALQAGKLAPWPMQRRKRRRVRR